MAVHSSKWVFLPEAYFFFLCNFTSPLGFCQTSVRQKHKAFLILKGGFSSFPPAVSPSLNNSCRSTTAAHYTAAVKELIKFCFIVTCQPLKRLFVYLLGLLQYYWFMPRRFTCCAFIVMAVSTAKVPMLSGRLKISDRGSWRTPGALTLRAGESDGNCGLAGTKK